MLKRNRGKSRLESDESRKTEFMSFRVSARTKEAMTRLQSYLQASPRDTVLRAVELMASVIDADAHLVNALQIELNEVSMRLEAARRVIELRAEHDARVAELEKRAAEVDAQFEAERRALLSTPEDARQSLQERLIKEAQESMKLYPVTPGGDKSNENEVQ